MVYFFVGLVFTSNTSSTFSDIDDHYQRWPTHRVSTGQSIQYVIGHYRHRLFRLVFRGVVGVVSDRWAHVQSSHVTGLEPHFWYRYPTDNPGLCLHSQRRQSAYHLSLFIDANHRQWPTLHSRYTSSKNSFENLCLNLWAVLRLNFLIWKHWIAVLKSTEFLCLSVGYKQNIRRLVFRRIDRLTRNARPSQPIVRQLLNNYTAIAVFIRRLGQRFRSSSGVCCEVLSVLGPKRC